MRTPPELERDEVLEARRRLRLVPPLRDERLVCLGTVLTGYLDASDVDLDVVAREAEIPRDRLHEIFQGDELPTTEELTDILGVLGVAPTAFWRRFNLEVEKR